MRTPAAQGLALITLLVAVHASAAEHHVSVGGQSYSDGYYYADLSFSPRQLTIQAGDTVVFDNQGGSHNVTADDGSFRCAQGCDGDGGNGNPSPAAWHASVTFDTPGTYGYHCQVHQGMGMTGSIIVQGEAPAPFNLDQQGLSGSWANAATESQGLVMTVWPDFAGAGRGLLFGGWFTFDVTAAGGQRWYTLQGDVVRDAASATMPIYLTEGGAFDTAQATTTQPVGEAVLRFDDCTHGSLAYAFSDGSGRSGTIPMTRLLGNVNCSAGGSNAGGDYLRSGAWADLGNSGQGLVMDVAPPQDVFFAAWYTFLADAPVDAGSAGQHWYTLQGTLAAAGPASLADIGIFDSSGGVFDRHATTTTEPVGSASITWHSCSAATLAYAFTAGPNSGRSGTLELTRLGPVPAGCSL